MKEEKENNKGKYKKWQKSPKGITLVALVITIIIIIILATVAISFTFGDNGLINRAEDASAFGDNGLINRAEDARDMYANDTAYTEGSIANVESYINEILDGAEVGGGTEPDDPTKPEEPVTDGSFSAEEGVNTPNIGANMQLVVFKSDTNEWVEDTTKEAYSYKDTSIPGNENKSEWANAKVTINGVESYFVWIPRFAYKINGTNDIDVKFINGTGKTTVDGIECKYASENPTADDYIVHPAFTDEEENGGWDEQLTGIWIGKYETSSVEGNSNISSGDNTTTKTAQVRAGVSSWRYIQIGNAYEVAKAYAPSLESHMLKNSEWGAVAYLTESQYGRNGQEVTINNNGTTYYTGGGDGNAYVTNTPQSSTGNVYGIYDLSGNAYEYVASYYKDGNFSSANSTFTTGTSDKYSTAYDGTDVNTDYKYGDATYETSKWHGDNAVFVDSNFPFFDRGGNYNSGSAAGVFYFGSTNRLRQQPLLVSFGSSSVMCNLTSEQHKKFTIKL